MFESPEVATLQLRSDSPAPPPRLRLTWSMPAHDVHGYWTTGARFNKALGPDWGPDRVSSMLSRNAPVMMLFGADDGNRLTFAVSEALNTTELTAGVREEDARVYGSIELFVEPHRAVSEVEVEVRFDRRAVPFHEALGDVSEWWAGHSGFEAAAVPDTARGQIGHPGDSLAEQIDQVYANIAQRLESAGATAEDLLNIAVYIPGYTEADLAALGPARDKYGFSGAKAPASTLLGIQSLHSRQAAVEIEGIAIVRR